MKRKSIPTATLLAYLSKTTQVELPILKKLNADIDRTPSPEEFGSVITINFGRPRCVRGDRSRHRPAG